MGTNTLLHLWMMGKCNTIRQLFAMSYQMYLDLTLNQLAEGCIAQQEMNTWVM